MPVRLTIRPPRTSKPQVVEFDEDRVTIGRSSRCDVRIPLRVVSGHHLTLLRTDAGLVVRDEKSTNGTLLDGKPLPADTDQALSGGGRLEILDLRIDVEFVPALGDAFSLQHTGTMARQLLGDALFATQDTGTDESAYFEVMRGPCAGEKLVVPDTLDHGRLADAADADLHVEGLGCALKLFRDGDGFGVEPTETSANVSPSVAGVPLDGPRRLASGETIVAGDVELRFVDPLEAYLEELDGAGGPAHDEEAPSKHKARPGYDTLTEDNEASPTSELDEDEERQNPDSTARGLGPVEVGVITLSVISLAGVVYLLLSIFGVV
ncbi:FHA domain-containing protein [Persicimonas caeni]|nr:FHA domain-containing protein [Persicimonas caeni]